ncbi:MAG: NtaA/DmoA family FMN-dependent monooxygenase [Actinomycetota bacterium]
MGTCLHLAQFMIHGPTWHSHAMWRHPRTTVAGDEWFRPELYEHVARTCERGRFDMVFFADLNYISDTYTGTLDPALRYAVQAPEHDPIPLLSYMAAATEHVGVASTFSTSNQHPFYVARLFATLDHLTRGRVGWNVVTSLNHNQSANYGEAREDTDLRYEKAHEFIEVCFELWDSWAEDAIVADPEAPQFADSSKVRRIDFEGQYFRSRGPLNVTRPPTGGPAILQAGTSPKGRDFAARYADAIFAIQPRPVDAAELRADIRDRAADAGRDPDHVKLLFGAQPIIGETEAHASELQEEHNELVPLEAGLAILSAHLDFDLALLDPDEPMAERAEPELQRMRTRYLNPDGSSMTVAEVAKKHGQSVGLPQIVGTATSVADQLEAYADEAGGDGFMLSPIHCPEAIEEFVDLVIPELQRRGRVRTEYDGTTIRDHLRQEW